MTFLTLLLSYSKLQGSVNTEGCVFVMREKRQSNKKIIKVTTCEKLKCFCLSFFESLSINFVVVNLIAAVHCIPEEY